MQISSVMDLSPQRMLGKISEGVLPSLSQSQSCLSALQWQAALRGIQDDRFSSGPAHQLRAISNDILPSCHQPFSIPEAQAASQLAIELMKQAADWGQVRQFLSLAKPSLIREWQL